jgi:hypothetical protein
MNAAVDPEYDKGGPAAESVCALEVIMELGAEEGYSCKTDNENEQEKHIARCYIRPMPACHDPVAKIDDTLVCDEDYEQTTT